MGRKAERFSDERRMFVEELTWSGPGSPQWEDALGGARARARALGATGCEAESSTGAALAKLDKELRAVISFLPGDARVDRAWEQAREQVVEARVEVARAEPWRAGLKAVLAVDAPAPMRALIRGAQAEGLNLLESARGGCVSTGNMGASLAWEATRGPSAKCLAALLEDGGRIWPRLQLSSSRFRARNNPYAGIAGRGFDKELAIPLGVALCRELVGLGWSAQVASAAVGDAWQTRFDAGGIDFDEPSHEAEAMALSIDLAWRGGAGPAREPARRI